MSSLNTVRMACLNACASVEGFHRSGYLHPRQTALFTLQQRDSWSFLQSALSGLKGTGPRLMEHSCRLGTASCLRGPLRSGFKTKKKLPFPILLSLMPYASTSAPHPGVPGFGNPGGTFSLFEGSDRENSVPSKASRIVGVWVPGSHFPWVLNHSHSYLVVSLPQGT